MKIILFCTYDIWNKEHLWIANKFYQQLKKKHTIDINYAPFRNLPMHYNKQVFAYRAFSFCSADVVITMGPFAHVILHKRKVSILTNHLNNFFELWKSPSGELENDISNNQRNQIFQIDNTSLQEAKKIYSFYSKIQKRYLGDIKIDPLPIPNIDQQPTNLVKSTVGAISKKQSGLILTDYSQQQQNDILLRALQLSKNLNIQLTFAGPVKRPDILESLKKQFSDLIINNQVRFLENPDPNQISSLKTENNIIFDTGMECDGYSNSVYWGIANKKTILSFTNAGYFAQDSHFSGKISNLNFDIDFLKNYFQNMDTHISELNNFYEEKYNTYNELPQPNWEEILL